MVRFHWHVEQGQSAYMPPDGVTMQKDTRVQHASCEVEVPGQKETLPAILTLPPNYLKPDKVKEVGIVLGHGSNAADWNGKFLTELAAALAAEGFLVVRCYCKQKEQRRQRMFEKALDAAATSPFAGRITRWLLAGIGNGARVAAVVGTKCRGTIAGFALLSYPLEWWSQEPEPMPPGKGRRSVEATPGPPDSGGPLLALQPPVLFISGSLDDLCNLTHLRQTCVEMQSSDIRFVVMKGADATLKPPQARSHNAVIFRDVADTVLEFAESLNQNSLHSSNLPRFESSQAEQSELGLAARPTASQSQEAQPMANVSQQAQTAVEFQQAQPVAVEFQQAQPAAVESQQAQPAAVEFQQAQPAAVDLQQAQPATNDCQQAQPMVIQSQQPYAHKLNAQTASVPHNPDMQIDEMKAFAQGQPALSHSTSYLQHTYHPGPEHFHAG